MLVWCWRRKWGGGAGVNLQHPTVAPSASSHPLWGEGGASCTVVVVVNAFIFSHPFSCHEIILGFEGGMRQREETERHRECTRCRTGDLGISGWRLFVTSSHSHTNTPDFMTSCDPLRHCYLVLRDRGREEMERKKSKMTKVKEMRDSEGVDTVQGQIMLRL